MGRGVGVPKGDNIGMVNDLEFEAGSIFVLNFFSNRRRTSTCSTTYLFLHENAGVTHTRHGPIPKL